jgi:hypothetical protein
LITDVDWEVAGGHYRVRLGGLWLAVPQRALVTEPNRFGPAVVWPYRESRQPNTNSLLSRKELAHDDVDHRYR